VDLSQGPVRLGRVLVLGPRRSVPSWRDSPPSCELSSFFDAAARKGGHIALNSAFSELEIDHYDVWAGLRCSVHGRSAAQGGHSESEWTGVRVRLRRGEQRVDLRGQGIGLVLHLAVPRRPASVPRPAPSWPPRPMMRRGERVRGLPGGDPGHRSRIPAWLSPPGLRSFSPAAAVAAPGPGGRCRRAY